MKKVVITGSIATLILAGVGYFLYLQSEPVSASEMTVYKSPTCGCCSAWIHHLEVNGFQVNAIDMQDVTPRKIQLGITPQTASCHTGVIDGYVIEGHVPAADIRRLLEEKPENIRGIAVPGMPIGSPGMEMGDRKDAYDVLAIDKDGNTSVFAKH